MNPESKKRTKRRGNGEGSIYQCDTGRWEACITVGYGANGKRVRRTVYGWTKTEVQEKLTRLQSRKLDGTLADPGRLTVAGFLDRWLTTAVKNSVRSTTYASYESTIRLHINPTIGGLPLSKLTPAHVQGLYSELERTKKSCYILRLTHAVLRRSLREALRWNMVQRNVCDSVTPPRVKHREIAPLTHEQALTLLRVAADDRQCALYFLAIASGLRIGELFGLHWCDVDLAAGTVAVRHTLTELNGVLTLCEPKTSKGRRLVEVLDNVVAALHEHRKRAVAEGRAGVAWVFYNSQGGPLRKSNFHRQDWKPLLKRAGLPNIRFHDLRHTSASLLLAAGVHPKVVQERLGHSQIAITMDTYSHVMPTMQPEAATKLGNMLTPQPAKAATA